MTVKSQIQAAINRSSSHNEIVHVTIDGDIGAALAAISELRDESTDYTMTDYEFANENKGSPKFLGESTDYTMTDYEGVDTLDIWGYNEDDPEGEMVWRLDIRFGGDK